MKKLHTIIKHKPSNFSKNASLLERGLAFEKKGQFPEAIKIYEKLLLNDPKNYFCRLHLGLSLLLNNDALSASKVLHLLHEEFPTDIDVLRLAANAYAKLGQFQLAIRFLKRAININPEDYESWLDLTSAAGSCQLHTEALSYATKALTLNPTDPRSHLNLGSTLDSVGRIDDALYCFETVLKLDPNNASAKSNCALIFDKKGESDKALDILSSCLKLVKPGSRQQAEIFYKMSYPLLSKGDLKRGWEMYEFGFTPNHLLARGPKRRFRAKKWEGQPIHGHKLLIWREQGLGDELMFLHTLKDVFQYCDDVIFECESRLTKLLQRSFQNCTVRPQHFDSISGFSATEDYDYHLPVGSLLNLFRSDISCFSKNAPYLTADPIRIANYSSYLNHFRPKKIVGICWRSGTVSADRNIHYAPLSSWKSIFEIENTIFVNLQYGDCSIELESANSQFGIKIHSIPDLDLRNDLEGVAALISSLDCVVSVGTTVAQMTGALGIPLKLLVSRDWVLLGQKNYPWFGNTELFASDVLQPVEPLIPSLAQQLSNFLHS